MLGGILTLCAIIALVFYLLGNRKGQLEAFRVADAQEEWAHSHPEKHAEQMAAKAARAERERVAGKEAWWAEYEKNGNRAKADRAEATARKSVQ